MNIPWILVGLGMTPLAVARSTVVVPVQTGAQTPAPAEAPGIPGALSGAHFDARAWAAALGSPDLAAREVRFGELVERALADHRVEALVRAWAKAEGEPELAWTSRLVLREMGRERDVLRALVDLRGGGGHDPFAALEARINGVRVATPGGPGALVPAPDGGPPGAAVSERSFRLEIGPTGARLEVRSSGPDPPASRPGQPAQAGEPMNESVIAVYEAPNIGLLLDQHPDLARELGEVRFFSEQGPVSRDQLFKALRGRVHTLEDFWSEEPASLRTDILGVQLAEGDRAGAGLLVERILPGTIAQVVGLRRGDLLLRLNGVALDSGEVVSRVLGERQAEAPLVVGLDREGDPLTLTWKPSPGGE